MHGTIVIGKYQYLHSLLQGNHYYVLLLIT